MEQIKASCLYFKTFSKPGEDIDSCQDACSINEDYQRFAISDGVTQSFLADDWAKILVNKFTEDSEEDIKNLYRNHDWKTWLLPAQKLWETQTKKRVADLTDSKHVVTRNRFILREPAAATFIGLRKKNSTNEKNWEVMIIGDSCLFHISKNNNPTSYLIKSSLDFNSRPFVFKSYHDKSLNEPTFMEIEVSEGDYILLCTDALSKLIMLYMESHQENLIQILKNIIDNHENYLEKFLESHRSNTNFPLESDDIGIMVIGFNNIRNLSDNNVVPQTEVQITESNLELPSFFQAEDNISLVQPDMLMNNEANVKNKSAEKEGILEKLRKNGFIWLLILTLLIFISVLLLLYLQNRNENQNEYTILAGSNIVFEPEKPVVLLEIKKDYSATILEEISINNEFWKKIEYSVWFVCDHVPNDQQAIQIDNPTIVYSSSTDIEPTGIIPAKIPIVIMERKSINNTVWCHITSKGYVKSGDYED